MATTITFTSDLEASPILQKGMQFNGILKGATNSREVAATSLDETNDRVMFLSLPADARLIALYVTNDDLDSNGAPALTLDIGLFYSGGQLVSGVRKASGDEIDDDALATIVIQGQSTSTAGSINLLTEAQDIANVGKPLWQLGNLSANPGGNILIGTSVGTAAATAAAGTITMTAIYLG